MYHCTPGVCLPSTQIGVSGEKVRNDLVSVGRSSNRLVGRGKIKKYTFKTIKKPTSNKTTSTKERVKLVQTHVYEQIGKTKGISPGRSSNRLGGGEKGKNIFFLKRC